MSKDHNIRRFLQQMINYSGDVKTTLKAILNQTNLSHSTTKWSTSFCRGPKIQNDTLTKATSDTVNAKDLLAKKAKLVWIEERSGWEDWGKEMYKKMEEEGGGRGRRWRWRRRRRKCRMRWRKSLEGGERDMERIKHFVPHSPQISQNVAGQKRWK